MDAEENKLRGASAARPAAQPVTVKEAAQNAAKKEGMAKSRAYDRMMTEW